MAKLKAYALQWIFQEPVGETLVRRNVGAWIVSRLKRRWSIFNAILKGKWNEENVFLGTRITKEGLRNRNDGAKMLRCWNDIFALSIAFAEIRGGVRQVCAGHEFIRGRGILFLHVWGLRIGARCWVVCSKIEWSGERWKGTELVAPDFC